MQERGRERERKMARIGGVVGYLELVVAAAALSRARRQRRNNGAPPPRSRPGESSIDTRRLFEATTTTTCINSLRSPRDLSAVGNMSSRTPPKREARARKREGYMCARRFASRFYPLPYILHTHTHTSIYAGEREAVAYHWLQYQFHDRECSADKTGFNSSLKIYYFFMEVLQCKIIK